MLRLVKLVNQLVACIIHPNNYECNHSHASIAPVNCTLRLNEKSVPQHRL